MMRRRCRIDAHAANRITLALRRMVFVIGGTIPRIGDAHKSAPEERAIAP
jgi:hypothetical protein